MKGPRPGSEAGVTICQDCGASEGTVCVPFVCVCVCMLLVCVCVCVCVCVRAIYVCVWDWIPSMPVALLPSALFKNSSEFKVCFSQVRAN